LKKIQKTETKTSGAVRVCTSVHTVRNGIHIIYTTVSHLVTRPCAYNVIKMKTGRISFSSKTKN